jgi:hypothetical protein
MNKSAKTIFLILFLCLATTAFAGFALAQSSATPASGAVTIPNPIGNVSFQEILEKVFQWIFYVAAAFVPLMIVWAGFLFVTAGGDPKKIETGKHIIMWTIIGMLVILMSRAIIFAIQGIIAGPTP